MKTLTEQLAQYANYHRDAAGAPRRAHGFEGRKPAFVDDLVGLLVGPVRRGRLARS